jgi:hypothetical protein
VQLSSVGTICPCVLVLKLSLFASLRKNGPHHLPVHPKGLRHGKDRWLA